MNRFERSQKTQRRVVVTGMGAVSPLGLTADETWKKALEGVSGISTITRFDPENYDAKIAGEVKNFSPDPYIPKKEQKKMDLFIQYAMAAADMAIADAEISPEKIRSPRAGVFVGAGMGGLPGIEEQHDILKSRGPSRVTPFFIPMVITNLASGQIAMKHGAQGPNFCVTSACATGAHSIGEATRYIRDGLCDVMIAGGTESTVCPLAIAGFSSMRALSTRNNQPTIASRPFDKDRDGFVLGEGAAILILEDYEHAEKRGATIYAEVTGYGATCDAYHMTNPAPGGDGAIRAMQLALKDAGISPKDVDYINAHGTSTPVGDGMETQAVKALFQDHAYKLSISSTKSMTGHLLGAAGALESFFCVMAIKEGKIPPTINLENPSPECDLDYTAQILKTRTIKHALNNSFGFGGTNASLLFSKL